MFIIEESGLEKSDEFKAKSGMIAVMSDGKERLILSFKGELVVAGKGDWFPYAALNHVLRKASLLEVREPVSNLSMNNFLDGKEYDFKVVWKAENPEKKKLLGLIEDLQQQINSAQEKLKQLQEE